MKQKSKSPPKKKSTKVVKKINKPHPDTKFLSIIEYNTMVKMFARHPNGHRPFKSEEFLARLFKYVRDEQLKVVDEK